MNKKLTPEQLNGLPKDALVLLILSMQDQLTQMDQSIKKLTEQVNLANNYRFGRHSEKLTVIDGQGSFDADGNIYFNEAEAICDAYGPVDEPGIDEVIKKRTPRPKGKKAQDLGGFPVIVLPTIDVSEEDRIREFGSLDNCRRMDDVVIQRLVYIPAGWKVEETHIAVYRSRTGPSKFLKGETPPYLLRGSIVTPSLEAAIINAKFTNAMPYRRIEKDFAQNGVSISEQDMASWTIKCSERYLSRLYEHLHKKLLAFHVLQADETTVEVSKDGRKTGAKSYMWVYRTGKYYTDTPIVLYEYQKTRNHEHPQMFLDGFSGYLVCDGFSGYKTLDRKVSSICIAECLAHARRYFSDSAKAAPNKRGVANDALRMIAAIYHAEGRLAELSPQERQKERMKEVRPLVDAFFAWVHQTAADQTLLLTGKTADGINYCINQEKQLRVFLEDGEVPIDNNSTEGTIRGFTTGRKNWMMIDTISGAKASAIIYSLVETAKANGLNTYRYFEYLLTELPKLKEFTTEEDEERAMEPLLPWSKDLPEICKKPGR